MSKKPKAKTTNNKQARGDKRLTQRDINPEVAAKVLKVAELTILGKTAADIADEMGLEFLHVRDLRQRADFKDLFAKMQDEATRATVARLVGLQQKAVDALSDAMHPSQETSDRTAAAKDVLDRSGVSKASSVTVKGAPPSAMTTAALRAELQELLDSTAEGENDDDAED